MDDDAFGWSTQQYAAEPCLPSRPSDDDGLLSAFMCTSFHYGLHSPDHQRGSLDDMSSSQTIIPDLVHCHDGAGLSDSVPPPPAFMGLDDTAEMLPSATAGAVGRNDGVFDASAYVANLAEGPAQATASNSNSGYSSTATGGNGNYISSSGESNTCGGGGQDVEVASRPTTLLQTPVHPLSKQRLGKYPASCASATTATATAEQRGAKRSAAPTTSSSTSITFGGQSHHHHPLAASRTTPGLGTTSGYDEPDAEAIAQVKEMIYRAAAMRPVHHLVVSADPPLSSQQNKQPRRKNVRISSDPQTVAARLRRERISERLRVLQRLVPGGSRMDTASMLDEAASYLKFLKSQLNALESAGRNPNQHGGGYCNGSRPL